MKSNAHQNTASAIARASTSGSILLQRKCFCGTHTPSGGECTACAKKKTLQKKLRIGAVNDPLEYEADRVADQVLRLPLGGETGRAPFKLQSLSHTGADHEGEVPDSVARTLSGSGHALDGDLSQDMGSRFGHDFSGVRIHQGSQAEQSARDVNAKAYTVGNNIVFGAGEYAPTSHSGRHLIAHELAHVVQQGTFLDTDNLRRKVNAVRFQDEPTLEEVSDGKKTLKQSDRGEAIVRIISALNQLGYYKNDAFDTVFGPGLLSAVVAFQKVKGVSTKPPGLVDQATFSALDAEFSGNHGADIKTLATVRAPDQLKQTQSIDPEERKATERAISTEPRTNPVTGALPTFAPLILGKGAYEDRLKKMVDDEIVSQFNSMGKGKSADHADPSKLFDWGQIGTIALESQKAVDAIFGEYTKGRAIPPAALKQGVNILDAWDSKVADAAAGGKAWEDASANWRVQKIITADENVASLDEEHGAIQSRPPEAAIVATVQAAMVAKYRTELIETHKGWPGFANAGKIFIQRFKGTAQQNRGSMWDFYQTFIHEYIHTLEHKDHVNFRTTLAEKKGNFVLREGTTDYFTKIVWDSITIDPALRQKIEGPFFDPKTNFAIHGLSTYNESRNAERLAGIVGLRNLAAAFFLGKVELIGKK